MATDSSAARVREHMVYTGHVQGVYFRATSNEIAQGRAIVGYVRNMPDGTVELEAEGRAEEVEAFLAAVARHFAGNITRVDRESVPPRNDERSFEIRYR